MSTLNGKVCYVEIPATDIDASSAFYRDIFGWNLRTRSDGSIAFDDGIRQVSGTWKLGRKPATEPGMIVSIMVDNVADTVAQIKAKGREVIKEMEIGPGQFIAWFGDPGGNVLGIYQHAGGGHGKICYLEIPVEDISKSAAFYEAVFPWSIRKDNHDNVAFDDSTGNVSGMWTKYLRPLPSGLIVYVMVDSV